MSSELQAYAKKLEAEGVRLNQETVHVDPKQSPHFSLLKDEYIVLNSDYFKNRMTQEDFPRLIGLFETFIAKLGPCNPKFDKMSKKQNKPWFYYRAVGTLDLMKIQILQYVKYAPLKTTPFFSKT